eukprot:scaffold177_cov334-Pavlova_lutheri.AAC.100
MTLRNDAAQRTDNTTGTLVHGNGKGKSAFAAYAGSSSPAPKRKDALPEACVEEAANLGTTSKTTPIPNPIARCSWDGMQTVSIHGAALLQHPMMHMQALYCSKMQEASNATIRVGPAGGNGTVVQTLLSAGERSGISQSAGNPPPQDLPQHHLPFKCVKRRFEPVAEGRAKVGKKKKTDPLVRNKEDSQCTRDVPAYRGVTRHKGTGRWEAHLWSGKHMYLGGFDSAKKAAQAYDKAVLTLRGADAATNFDPAQYEDEVQYMMALDKKELVGYIRRQSSCWTRGSSRYRGVTKNASSGRWEARLGHFSRTSCRYLGVFRSEEEAARAYDIEMIKCKGMEAITNFPLADYATVCVKQEVNLEAKEDSPLATKLQNDG